MGGDISPGQASGGWDRDGLLAMMGQRLVAIVGRGQVGGHSGTWTGGHSGTGTGWWPW